MRMPGWDPEAREELAHRFREWWEGTPRSQCARPESQDCIDDSDASLSDAEANDGKADSVPDLTSAVDCARICQDIWGAGFLAPGGDEYVVDLAKPLGPTSKDTMLMLSAELGGPAQAVTEHFDVWISAFESSNLLSGLGVDEATGVDLDRKINFEFADFEKVTFPERKYAYALWNGGLFRVSDKPRILQAIYDSLKPGAGLVITDFVTSEPENPSPDILVWTRKQPVTPTMLSADGLLGCLMSQNFTVPIHEDVSDKYQRVIISAWKQWLELIPLLQEQGKLDANFRKALMGQLQYWVTSADLIKSGDLKLYRFLALKPEDSLASLK